MAIKRLNLKDFTVFDKLDMEFSDGLNIFVGANGTGKTHVLKLLYGACQAADQKVSFSQKIVGCFAPDEHRIARLVRRKQGNNDASIRVTGCNVDGADSKTLSAKFSIKTKKWEAEIQGEDGWEKLFQDLTSTFIPAKEILSNAHNLSAAVDKGNVSFDDTYVDIVSSAKVDISSGADSASKHALLEKIEKIIAGKVYFDTVKDEFYLKHGSSKLEFNLVAEGIRKIALIWQLAKNGTLEKGSVLFWDEPEANINPCRIPIIADILLTLQRYGVQVFIATHDYILAKYIEIRAKKEDKVAFYSFYQNDDAVACERNAKFSKLTHNTITEAFDKLLDEVYTKQVDGDGE